MNPLKIIFENYKLFNKDPIDGVSIDFNDENPFEWKLIIIGQKIHLMKEVVLKRR